MKKRYKWLLGALIIPVLPVVPVLAVGWFFHLVPWVYVFTPIVAFNEIIYTVYEWALPFASEYTLEEGAMYAHWLLTSVLELLWLGFIIDN